jgi:hypothetical protein
MGKAMKFCFSSRVVNSDHQFSTIHPLTLPPPSLCLKPIGTTDEKEQAQGELRLRASSATEKNIAKLFERAVGVALYAKSITAAPRRKTD